MANDGVITQKDIIEDKALTIGKQYADNMQFAINANKEMVSSLKEINKIANDFKGAKSQSEYITLKQQQTLATQKLIGEIKAQEQAEISLQKIEQATLITQKKKIELDSKEATEKKKLTKLTIDERVQNEVNNRVLKEEARERLGLVGVYTKLNAKRTEAKKVLLDLLAAETKDIAAIKEATRVFTELDKRVRSADQAVGDFHKSVGNYPKLNAFANGLKNLVGAFGLVGGVTAFAAVLSQAFKTIKEFEQSLADLSSITGASGKDLDFLKNSAIDLGQKVQGGAKAVVEAYKLIASAKPELLSNVKALNQVTEAAITLAQAAGMELPEAATALTDAMNQFGVGADSAQEFIDALANGAKFGSAEIPQLTEALLKFGAVARSSNINIKESAALVELLAENGLKGAEAGTALRNILLKISAPDALPKAAKAELEGLGISMEKLKDKTIPIQQKLELLKPLLKDNASIVKVFGLENATSAINVLEHTERLEELTKQMSDVGTAEEQAAIRMNTLTGKTELLKSTYDSLVLSIGKGSGAISEFFKFFIQGADSALKGLIRLNTSWNELNEKAKQQGTAEGAKTFEKQFNFAMSFGSKDVEGVVESIRKAAFNQRKVLYEEFLKNQKALKDFNPFAINISGPSGKDLKLQKERLLKAIALQDEIMNQAEAKKLSLKKKTDPTATTTTEASGPTEEEIKAALKRAKELNDALYELERQRLERLIKINDEIASDDKLKDDVRIQAVKNVNDKEIALAELTKKHKLDADKFVLDEDKMNANQKLFIQREAANKIVDVNKKAQKDIDKIREFDEASYQKSLDKRVSRINENMNKEIELENTRFKELGDLGSMHQKDREKTIEAHEERIFQIKKKAALASLRAQADTLQDELNASDLLPDKERLSAEKRQEIAEKLSKARSDISEKELEEYDKRNKEIINKELALAEDIRDISSDLSNALGDLANALFEAKIQNIDLEIEKNNEFYEKQIELAGDDEAQKKLLEIERQKKEDELNKKKRKEQEKQAKFNKALAIAQAALNLGVAVTAALTVSPPASFAFAAITAAIAGVQLAAVIATPIPKYKMGRKGGKKETAIVGDGGVHEVIERKSGAIEVTPNKDTLVQLMQGDSVHSSIDDYMTSQRKKVGNDVKLEAKKINEFQKLVFIKDKKDPELVNEIKKLRKSVERNKPLKSDEKNVDLSHALWKLKNQF